MVLGMLGILGGCGLKLVGDHLSSCPPPEANAGEGDFFRFMRNGQLAVENFQSHVELGKVPDTCCKGHALSLVPGTLDAVEQRVKEQPFFKKFGLASLKLGLEHGKLHHDQEYHASWWRPRDLTPERLIEEKIATLHSTRVATLFEKK
jgi:hypothetical protein